MKKLIILLISLVAQFSQAQQLPMYSQYYWNDYIINPAFTGLRNSPRIQLGYRNQWSGFTGAPSTFTLGGHAPIKSKHMGVGGMVFSDDQGGAITQNGVLLNYSYQIQFDKKSLLSLGLSGVINQYSFSGSSLQNIAPDPILQQNLKQVSPDLNFGIVYNWNDKLYIGLAVNQLIQSRLSNFNSNNLEVGNTLVRHFNFSTSYLFQLNSLFDFQPYALVRTSLIQNPQFELGAKTTFNRLLFAGLSYRNAESIVALAGFEYQQFMLGYSYDFGIGPIKNYSNGSHEIVLAYRFDKKKETTLINEIKEADQDNDGILDKDDLCPEIAGLIQHKGCPDSDNDGVFDDIDECPKVVGSRENNGCPWPDTDGDGLTDNKDNCPKTVGPIDNLGCPYGDSDNDGINDKEDNCPLTAGPKENKGCPIIEKKDQEVLDMAFKNLEFETNESTILENSKASLFNLAETLKSKTNWTILLSGHTDDVGDAEANMILSKNRVVAVKNYLVSNGVKENKIRIAYFGESKPISDNSTLEGRQKNRRVEFTIIFD